jgi:predicted kinase
MPRAIILQGVPASGKSTWAKKYCTKNKDWIRVSRDDLRNMRGQYWIPKQENLITKMERDCIESALLDGKNVIVDATNFNPKHLKSLKDFIKEVNKNTHIEIKRFDISLEEAIRRDVQRANGVGEKIIKNFFDKYINPPVEKMKQDESLPKAIICDIDGTVAEMVDRKPYDWHRVIEDAPRTEIINLVKMYRTNGYKIIFFTGRDGNPECCNQTIEWLEHHFEWTNEKDFDLYMRTADDNRKDSIIKKEMFHQYVEGKYYIENVIDDRDSVVKMWRNKLGLSCVQVNWGDF